MDCQVSNNSDEANPELLQQIKRDKALVIYSQSMEIEPILGSSGSFYAFSRIGKRMELPSLVFLMKDFTFNAPEAPPSKVSLQLLSYQCFSRERRILRGEASLNHLSILARFREERKG
jgi:hypothetical protein